jgi:hypothetical protein
MQLWQQLPSPSMELLLSPKTRKQQWLSPPRQRQRQLALQLAQRLWLLVLWKRSRCPALFVERVQHAAMDNWLQAQGVFSSRCAASLSVEVQLPEAQVALAWLLTQMEPKP